MQMNAMVLKENVRLMSFIVGFYRLLVMREQKNTRGRLFFSC
jgi:hypothetical protein